ncbi:MAG TPA: ABC transporter ATP-binding protein [Thermoleophilaceae bacterium]|nr:ABC transporter ATP-binding protein [Thermoleophilaceae bacterium]
MASIQLRGVGKSFGDTVAVTGVDLTIEDGEFLVLVGPSGCGKSTLLRVIAGLESVSSGSIAVDGADVTQVAPEDRDLAMVFQDYALYPHMTVERNLGFGLKLRGVDKAERARRVGDVAAILGLDELMARRPAELSGGQRQRVALGRAMVRQPKAFLMDEPLSNLDARLRTAMRAELARLHERLGVTSVYVTHDQTEAMTLGSRVAVLRDGVLQQCGTPLELYERPANLFVASFIGSPQMNLVRAAREGGEIRFGGWRLPLPDRAGRDLPDELILGIRPSDLHVAGGDGGGPDLPAIDVVPAVVEELGSERQVVFPVDAPPIDADGDVAWEAPTEDDARLLADDARSFFVATLPARTPVAIEQPFRLAVDTDWIYLFDAVDGRTLLVPPAAG